MSAGSGMVLGGRYELGEVLGYGGMAEVFLALDVRLGRQVAVKVLRSDLARDPSFLARFRREAQSAASLSHPSIVSVFDTGQDEVADGTSTTLVPWIVMEHVEGRTLRDVLREEGRLLPRRAVEIISEVCSALAFAHRNGLVHRDIKPANVMLTRSGQVKVMDFGIARALSTASGALTQTAAVVGTAQYLSPEQARGELVDARSDIYSTGCLLYELLTGRPPFQGDSPVSVAYQHVREAPIPPSQLDPEITPDLDAIVLTAMAKDPVNRYQSGESFREDLDRFASGRRVQAVPVMAEPPTSAAATTSYLPAGAVTEVLWEGRSPEAERSRRRKGYVAIFIACILALAGAAFLVAAALSGGGGGTTTMPQLVGQTQNAAIQTLKDHHLTVGKITQEYQSSDINKGKVIAQTISDQIPVNRGDAEDFTVSAGVQYVNIPTVKGFLEADATKTLTGLGFTVGTSIPKIDTTQPPGTVLDITPAEGSKQPKGTQVVLTVVSGKVIVPSLTGLPDQRHATDKLKATGLNLGNVTRQPSTQRLGSVIAQNPQPGTSVDRGATVDLVLADPMPSPSPSPSTSPSPVPSSSPTVDPASPLPSPVVDPASPPVDPTSPIP